MAGLFALQGKLAGRAPWVALGIVALLTGALLFGMTLTEAPQGDQAESFLPPGSELAVAQEKIQEDFGGSQQSLVVQLIVRAEPGVDLFDPAAAQEVLDLIGAAAADGDVVDLVAENGVSSYAHVLAALLGGPPGDATRADIDAAVAAAPAAFAPVFEQLVAREGSRAVAALGLITLDTSAGSDGALERAQLAIEESLDAAQQEQTLTRSFSGAKLNQETTEAQGTSTNLLMGAALLIILVVLVVFYRTGSDVALSILGLILTIVWTFGAQGYLGPGGIGLIGADNPLALMIPVLLIGLCVDYALQVTGRYREHIAGGEAPSPAIENAVRHSGLPLLLAAGTTMVGFATNVTSSLPPIQDFGIVAAVGVFSGWLVMTTLVPAGRVLFDRRRAARGKKLQDRAMADAIPGVGALVGRMSATISRHPSTFLGIVAVVSVFAFWGAANVSTTFSQTDFLPENTESYEDITFLAERFGGGDAVAQVLIEGDLTDFRFLLDISAFHENLQEDPPTGVTGPVRSSFITLITDWAVDEGPLDPKFDPAFRDFLTELVTGGGIGLDPEEIGDLYDQLEQLDPEGYAQVLALHPEAQDGDRTLLTVPVTSGDPDETRAMIRGIERAWEGDPDAVTVTGADVLTVAVTDEMTDSQLQSVAITIVAALVVLVVFFGITERRPALGIITVLPIGLVVGWVLGSMFLLGISYNVMTALITALTIGVGVDYTIHVTHRFLEELEEGEGIAHALARSMTTTGGALIGSALTTALGFAVLVFSPLAPMQQFGGLTALTILYSLLAAFLALPPMLVIWALFHEWKERQTPSVRVETSPVRNSAWVLAGVGGPEGSVLNCPRCRKRTFVPTRLDRLRCPTYGCSYEGANPHHQPSGPAR
ncbi:MAG: efflux RND transporter permease subunit [Thermoplasmatota archaeon]